MYIFIDLALLIVYSLIIKMRQQTTTITKKENPMSSKIAKYYYNDIELKYAYMQKSTWAKNNGAKKVDSFSVMVGPPVDGPNCIYPANRLIFYSTKPSLHKCDARCMNAKGHNCECSCGGKNHGINNK